MKFFFFFSKSKSQKKGFCFLIEIFKNQITIRLIFYLRRYFIDNLIILQLAVNQKKVTYTFLFINVNFRKKFEQEFFNIVNLYFLKNSGHLITYIM